ncbi:SLC13 family permease [Pelagicoccus sp. SDUM812005]|uniref:SLC13 family permease n=1 Tax=Pelagicoccus sp. SDUM812005 TaxID=3041257 RepID=UPI00280F6635|nr:SLC13 family permease [Pelagicoccus sp. SDUM812005]MDQ8181021.1 SLC13 family permease [Pelagicoccus sp. SDUM812005]
MSAEHSRIQESLEEPSHYGLRQWSGWVVGPGLLLVTLLFDPPAGLSVEGWRTAGAAALMATWWISESVPIPVTALLPLALFPLLGLGKIKEVAAPYANPLVFLFLGGFLIALAMQRWNLHRRVAVGLIGALGTRPNRIVAGFLLSGALLSMWVSNTATALMMLPIATSVVALASESSGRSGPGKHFGPALMLAVAYGATTGGMATLIGTPPNALLAGYLNRVYGYEIGFGQWMMVGLPVTLLALPVVYLTLTRIVFKLGRQPLQGMEQLLMEEKGRLGRFSKGERWVATVFAATALCWIFRPLLADFVPMISDTTIAIAGAVILFMIPVNLGRGQFVMDWGSTKGLPWDVLLLFGGGLSLAGMIQAHGLSSYLGTLCEGLGGWPVFLVLGVICFGILMLTELTSNTATAATFLPIVGAVAVSLGQNPLLFLIPTALAANCSYMMPVGTPPNAIVFGSGVLQLPQMAKAGLLLNVLLVPVVLLLVWLLGSWVFDIELGELPAWAGKSVE